MRDIHKRFFLWVFVGCAFLLYGCSHTEEFDSEKSTEDAAKNGFSMKSSERLFTRGSMRGW